MIGKKHMLLGLVLSLILNIAAAGQELVRPVITGAPFLQLIPDARSAAMGETGVATAGDVFSQFHNPAKYLFMEEVELGGGISYLPQHAGFATDIFMGGAAYFQSLGEQSVISASLTYYSFGKITLEEQQGDEFISQGSFAPNELALDVSYSLRLSENYGMAVTGRYVRSDIADAGMGQGLQLETANAVAADISGFYSYWMDREKHLTFGFALKNLGSKLKYSEDDQFSYPLPTSLQIGGGYHKQLSRGDLLSFYAEIRKYLVSAVDDKGNLPEGSTFGDVFASFGDAPDGFAEEMKELIYGLGTEYGMGEQLKLRAGYMYQHREKGIKNHLSLGVGLNWQQFDFDLAYQTLLGSSPFRQNNALRLSVGFGI